MEIYFDKDIDLFKNKTTVYIMNGFVNNYINFTI